MTTTQTTTARRTATSLRSEERFLERLAERGATLLETEWLGAGVKHRIQCQRGHITTPRPADYVRGAGVCRMCPAGALSESAEAKFRVRLSELGVTLLDREWRGSRAYYRARCSAGHECRFCPDELSRGKGGCRTCGIARASVARSAKAEAAFLARLAELGAVLLEPGYLGSEVPHRVRCEAGHECAPRPLSVGQGQGICRVCARRDPKAAEAAFRLRLAAVGAELLEPQWLGSVTRHRIRCERGHLTAVTPNNAQRWGVCRKCKNKGWDAFYVVTDDEARILKLGITTGTGRTRLDAHRRNGFETLHRLVTGLPGETAPALERAVLGALALAGEQPVRGREYFHARVLALVLDVADNYPTGSTESAPDTWKATA